MLSWTRVPDALTYEVVVDNNSDFSSPEFTERTANTTVVPTNNFRTGTISWRVRAISGSEASDWATSTFDPGTVGVPQPVSPPNTERLKQPAEPPLLTWSAIHGATEYIVEVDRDLDFIGAASYTTRTTSLVVPDPLGAGIWHWRVKASRGAGLVSDPSAPRSLEILPIDIPTLVSPANDSNTVVEDVVLDWKRVPGAKSYEVEVANNDTFTNVTETRTGILGTNYSPVKGYNNDEYYWRVRAIDLGGTATPWAESQFLFDRQWPDRPWPVFPVQDGFPSTPDTVNHDPLDLPNKVITTSAPYFQWTPVQHASHYQLDVSNDSNFSKFWSCRIAGTTYTPGNFVYSDTNPYLGVDEQCSIQEGTPTFWRVRPMDAPFSASGLPDGVQGIYSPTQRFTWDPAYFKNLSPVGGASVAVPTLSWTPELPADKYKIELYKGGSTSAFHTATTYATSYTPVDVELKPSEGPFTWRLSAIEAGGRSSALESNTFNVSGASASTGAPALTALSGRSSDPATPRAPSLTWEPHPLATHYRVSIGDDDGTNFYWIPTWDESFGKTLRFPAFTETGKRALRPGAYKWVVEAFDASGPVGESAVNTFYISNFTKVTSQRIALDGKPLDDPAGGCALKLADAQAFCNNVPATPVLSWDHVPGMSFYVVYTSQDAKFTNLTELKRIPATTNTRYAFTFANTKTSLPDNESGVPYYWHIRPCKAVGVCGPDPISTSTSLATNAFLKSSPKVELLSPSQGASVDTHEVTFDWTDYFDTNRTVTWRGETSPQSAKWYRVQVDDNSNFSTVIDDIRVDQSTYTAFTKLYPEGTLHWRVAAIDGGDHELNWSQPFTFVKSSPRLSLASPTADSTVSGTAPFRWGSQAFTNDYVIEVYRNADTTFSNTNLVFSSKVKTAAYAWTSPLPPSPTPYVWQVRRVDPSGNDGPWSSAGKFTVDGGTLSLISPFEGAAQPPNGPVLHWNPLLGASKYRVEVVSLTTGQSHASVTTVATAFAPASSLPTGNYRWTVTALDPNSNALTTAARTFSVDAGLTATSAPVIAAPVSSAIGQTLTSSPPVWNQDGVTNYYQWLRDGYMIYGANSATYTMAADDYTKQISLAVIGKKSGYNDGKTVSNAIGVTAGGALQPVTAPAISGTAAVGSALTVTAGSWSMPSPTIRYQWLRSGAPIPNANSSYYQLTAADAGKDIAATVFASKSGFNEGSASTAPVTVARLKSTTTLALSAIRVPKGKRVKIGITVAVPNVTGPIGTIKVYDGAKVLKTLPLVSARLGKVSWKMTKLKPGKHKIKAVYLGNASTIGSKSKVTKLIVARGR